MMEWNCSCTLESTCVGCRTWEYRTGQSVRPAQPQSKTLYDWFIDMLIVLAVIFLCAGAAQVCFGCEITHAEQRAEVLK